MYRLIYKSRSAKAFNWDIVRDITSTSEANNERSGVSGVLIASRSHLLQVLKGKFESINSVFRRIAVDDRHSELSIVSFSVVDARLFGGWGM